MLTKNEGNTLPLTDRSIKLAVIGPGASSLRLLYGGYTQPSMLEMFQVVQDSSAMAGVGDKSTAKPVRKYDLAATDREIHKSRPEAKTIFEALQELYPNCTYTQGCDYLDPTQTDFAAALAAAESADAVILCLSGKMAGAATATPAKVTMPPAWTCPVRRKNWPVWCWLQTRVPS